MKKFSIILCSRNREPQVRKCLASLGLGPFPDHEGEVVLVDSASTDSTAKVFADFNQGSPEVSVKVVTVDQPGLSIARNAGVRASEGEILIFLDDDVYFDDEYISKVLKRFEALPPEIGFLGGRIFRKNPEDSEYGCCYNMGYKVWPPLAAVRPGDFQGTNFSVRRSAYEAVGGFDDDLGAGKRFRCEDVDFVARVLSAGIGGVFDPELIVFHDHGRKDGESTVNLDRANIYACGAFYAKMVRLGKQTYLPRAVAFSLKRTARRLLPSSVKYPPAFTSLYDFWLGFIHYWKHASRSSET